MPVTRFNYDIDTPKTNCEGCQRTTYIRRMNVTVVDCGDQIHNELCDLWNNHLCGNDSCYCNPWIAGDKIYLQFNLPVTITNWFNIFGPPKPLGTTSEWGVDYFAALIDENGDLYPQFSSIETFASEYGIGVNHVTGKPFVWMVIDTNLLQGICNFNVTVADGPFTEDPENPIVNQFYTEPYCCVKCDEDTIMVCGTYNKTDPFGHFYGEFEPGSFTGDQNGYKACIRVYGNIEKVNNAIENTYTELVKVKAKINPSYLLRTNPLPEYVADLLTVALAGQTVTIDGVEYDSPESVDKNNQEGRMWLVESTLVMKTEDVDFECD